MGCFIYCIFGSSKDITIGPTAIMSALSAQYTSTIPCKDDIDALADVSVLLAFLTGLIILAFSILRIGKFVIWRSDCYRDVQRFGI